MTPEEKQTRQELEAVEQHLLILQEQRQRIEGHRDELVRRLCDNEGAASNRFAVR